MAPIGRRDVGVTRHDMMTMAAMGTLHDRPGGLVAPVPMMTHGGALRRRGRCGVTSVMVVTRRGGGLGLRVMVVRTGLGRGVAERNKGEGDAEGDRNPLDN